MRVLIVEDEDEIATLVRRALERERYEARRAATGSDAIAFARTWDPHLILLDRGLPDIPGEAVAQRLRAFTAAPIIMVTAMGEAEHRVGGLDAGADDYLVKPFIVEELLARVRAALRRASMPKPVGPMLEVGDLVLDSEARTAVFRGEPLELKEREFDILCLLVRHAGELVRRDEIARAVWGLSPTEAANSLDVHMSWLRTKLGDDPRTPRYIETVRGRGFRFLRPGSEASGPE